MQRRVANWYSAWATVSAARRFRRFGFGCSFIAETAPGDWFPFADDPRTFSPVQLELQHGQERARADYNAACLAEVRRTHRTYIGQRGGLVDLFVPVASDKTLHGVLVAGPILTQVPTLELLQAGWRALSGQEAVDVHGDGFWRYARAAIASPVFDGRALPAFVRWLEAVGAVMAGREATTLPLLGRLIPEMQMWVVSSELVDPGGNAAWVADYRVDDRRQAGIARIPNYVIALAPLDRGPQTRHPVEALLRVDALQRACARFAATVPYTLAGRLGGEGAFLVTHLPARPTGHARRLLGSFAEKVSGAIRRAIDMRVACGISDLALLGSELPRRYDEAVWAVLSGLHRERAITFYADSGRHDPSSPTGLYQSSRSLCEYFRSGKGKETTLAAHQVVNDVLWASGGSIEGMRSHFLDLVWELLSIEERRGAVDRKSIAERLEATSSRLRQARSARELTTVFTESVEQLFQAVEDPRALDRRAKLERARTLIEQGDYQRRLDMKALAARVGLSRWHLSRAFKAAYGVGIAEFTLGIRLQRSKDLLRETALTMAEISADAGFSSTSYFHQAFRRRTRMTPEQYRKAARVIPAVRQ
jgi:AraC-like DNA-binding protein